jgi:hypothetical protein
MPRRSANENHGSARYSKRRVFAGISYLLMVRTKRHADRNESLWLSGMYPAFVYCVIDTAFWIVQFWRISGGSIPEAISRIDCILSFVTNTIP